MSWAATGGELTPDAAPAWLKPLVDNAQRRQARLPPPGAPRGAGDGHRGQRDRGAVTGARRDAAVLVLFSGPAGRARRAALPDDADLLVTVRASTLRHHAGQAAFPGGAADPGDDGPVHTALREATRGDRHRRDRLQPLATLERMFIPPSGFHVVPGARLLRRSRAGRRRRRGRDRDRRAGPGARVRQSGEPDRWCTARRTPAAFAGPAFLLNEMLVWGFTGQVISAMLDVAGWAQPWNTDDVRELDDAMALVGRGTGYGEVQQ